MVIVSNQTSISQKETVRIEVDNLSIILFNGPPRSGKDTCRDFANTFIHRHKIGISHSMGFSDPLKRATCAAFGLDSPAKYENVKDIPNEDFAGRTPRQAYIEHAEFYMKKLYGRDIYGRILTTRIFNLLKSEAISISPLSFYIKEHMIFIAADAGFAQELSPLVATFGKENILLIRIHKEGAKFNLDSRYYLSLEGSDNTTIDNSGDKLHIQDQLFPVLDKFLHRGQNGAV